MRLFFALMPDSSTRARLSRSASDFRIPSGAYRLAAENYHITLAFIGEVPEGEVPAYRAMGAALSVPHCAIELDGPEYWQSSQAVVLAASENPHPLVPLVDGLRASTAARAVHGGAGERWRAHATLARKVAQAPVLSAISPVTWTSDVFALMCSPAGGGRAVYTVVDSWPLLDKR